MFTPLPSPRRLSHAPVLKHKFFNIHVFNILLLLLADAHYGGAPDRLDAEDIPGTKGS